MPDETIDQESGFETDFTDLDNEALILFGGRPNSRQFKTAQLYRQGLGWWEQANRYFAGIDYKTEATEEFQSAATEAEYYGLGRPRAYFFRSTQTTFVFFPDVYRLSLLNGSRVDFAVGHFLVGVAQTIARIQSWVIREGHWVVNVHPFVPFQVRAFNESNRQRFVNAVAEQE